MDVEFKIRARRGDLCFGPDNINIYAYQKRGRERFAAKKLELVHIPENQVLDPFLTIETHVAQQLMDDLWEGGLRPSEGTGSAGSMAATQKHLEDMRNIAFRTLKFKVPGL